MRKYWIISPNVNNDSSTESQWVECIQRTGRIFIGYDESHETGKKFKESINIGDIVLVAQGANNNKRLFIAGIVNSDAKWQHIEQTPTEAFNRRLNPFTIIDSTTYPIDFNGAAFGEANRIPALYQLHPKKNSIDKQIVLKLKSAIRSQRNKLMMEKYINLLKENKNIILTGAPGTGKTYLAKKIANELIAENKDLQKKYSLNHFIQWLEDSTGLKNSTFKQYKSAIKSVSKEQNNFENLCKNLDSIAKTYQPKTPSDPSGAKSAVLTKLVGYKNIMANSTEIVKGGAYKFVQFHPSYDYTDFVEGLRPIKEHDSEDFRFKLIDGIFKKFCGDALLETDSNFIFIIDEINRGEISKIFGELFFSIDPGYRGVEGKVVTQYANMQDVRFDESLELGEFYVPKNIYIIGTMNDIDRSVESFDFAMRRRFTWIEVKASDRIGMWYGEIDAYREEAEIKLTKLNKKIEEIQGLNSSYHIGPAYFLKLKNYTDETAPFDKLWDYHIEPLLKEYLRGNRNFEEELEKLKKAYAGENS